VDLKISVEKCLLLTVLLSDTVQARQQQRFCSKGYACGRFC